MFYEMFAASTLATLLFSGNNTNTKDYSMNFYNIDNKLDKLDNKLNKIIDTQAFMRARSCLENFSPLLLEGISLSYKYHSIQTIMEGAKEGFDLLCKTAIADENNFKEARKIFADTWGNAEWVNTKFGKEIDEWQEKTANCEREYASLKPVIVDLNKKLTDIFCEIIQNTPTKKRFFKTVIDKKKTKALLKTMYATIRSYPEMSHELSTYLVENDDKSLDLTIYSDNLKTQKELYFHDLTLKFYTYFYIMKRDAELFANELYEMFFERFK